MNNLPRLILAEINQIHFLTSLVCSLSLHGLSDFLQKDFHSCFRCTHIHTHACAQKERKYWLLGKSKSW